MNNVDRNCVLHEVVRFLLKGMLVSAVCLIPQRSALSEDATPKATPGKRTEAIEARTHFTFKKRGKARR